MRTPAYLSYSAQSKYKENIDEFVLRYLSDDRPDREPQGKPASVGSAFDAKVKAHMYTHSYGEGYMPEKYSFEALFEKQVEPQNRDFAGAEGLHVFESYQTAGFLDRLKALADRAVEAPQYEFRVEATVGGVPLLGLPDGYFRLPIEDSAAETLNVIADFKVNGYCGKAATSPNPGFLLCRDGYVATKQSRSHATTHKNATVSNYKGIEIGGWMEDACEAWASQLSGYAWCMGEPVGSEDVVLLIHQIVAKPMPNARPLLRCAEFAGPVRKPFQDFLLTSYQQLWNAITNDHIYPELSKEESQKRFKLMNEQATYMVDNADDVFLDILRPKWRGF